MTDIVERLRTVTLPLITHAELREAAAEIDRLRAAGDAAFYAMCNQRDTPDTELFQDAIDSLGMALRGEGER